MALTYTNLHKRSIGGDYLIVEQLQPASSDYVTGGYVLDKTFGGYLVDGIVKAVWDAGMNSTAVTTGVMIAYNYTTGGLQAFKSNTSSNFAEVSNGADLSAFTFVVCVIGK